MCERRGLLTIWLVIRQCHRWVIRSSSNPDCNQRRSFRRRLRLAQTTSDDRGLRRRFDNRQRRDVNGQTASSANTTWSMNWSVKPSTSVEGVVNRTDNLTMDSNLTESKSDRLRLVIVWTFVCEQSWIETVSVIKQWSKIPAMSIIRTFLIGTWTSAAITSRSWGPRVGSVTCWTRPNSDKTPVRQLNHRQTHSSDRRWATDGRCNPLWSRRWRLIV